MNEKSALENYRRDNKYSRSLQIMFDKHIEIDIHRIIEILTYDVDTIHYNEVKDPTMNWETICLTKNEENLNLLINKFSFVIRDKHSQYKHFLKRFIDEHLMFKEAIIFKLKNQIRSIQDILRRLEIDYFEKPEDEHALFFFKFRDVAFELLQELIVEIKNEYKQYLVDIDTFEEAETILLKTNDDGDFITVSSKITLLNELGIIDFLKNNHNQLNTNTTHLAKVISKFISAKDDTIRRILSDIKSGRKNDPYNSASNIKMCENLFNTYDLKKKGE